MSEETKKPSKFSAVRRWFRELRSESKKIIWPSASQVVNNTLIVIVAILIVGVLVWIVDFGFQALRDLLISLA